MSKTSREALCKANARLAQADVTLWGASAQSVASERLGWINLPEKSRELLPSLDALAAWARSSKIDRVVLSGMGGSSLAPEVIAQRYERDLVVLDSTHPSDVRAALSPDPSHSLFIISSKSGETIETLSHLKAITERLTSAGLSIQNHLVVISDPGSPLLQWADEQKVRYLPGESNVGGRFSALSTFGLLPAALLGVDCTILLDDAADIRERLQESDSENPAIQLAEVILAQQPFLALPDQSLSYWVEQLIAESTGKEGRGIIPIITSASEVDELVHQVNALPLGAAFYLWEWTVALLGYALEVNPFDQPDVARAKSATSRALHSGGASTNPVAQTTQSALALIDQKFAFTGGYIGILAFVPMRDKSIRQLMYEIRQGLHDRYRLSEKKVTLGFGPRYLHSTGQCHKGGPGFGAFLIITLDEDLSSDFPIPNEEYTFAQLLRAQASGDYEVLADIGRPVVHAHLTREELVKFSQSLHVTS